MQQNLTHYLYSFVLLLLLPISIGAQDRQLVETALKKYKGGSSFQQNKGQWASDIHYKASSPQANLYFMENRVRFGVVESSEKNTDQLSGHIWNMHFVGTSPDKKIMAKASRSGFTNYLKKERQIANVCNYEELWYQDIYPKTDLRFYSKEDGLVEYDFILYPGAKISNLRLALEGLDQIELNEQGQIVLHTSLGELKKGAPYTYQVIDGQEMEVRTSYKLEGEELSFVLQDDYNPDYPLIIDPIVLEWSTFLGGADGDVIKTLEVDAAGDIYAAGYTFSIDFPTTVGAFQTNTSDVTWNDAFLAKMDAGGAIEFVTYFGGNDEEHFSDIEVDASGNIYTVGWTFSNDLPTTAGAFQTTNPSAVRYCFMVSKFNSTGSALQYSTYVGGTSYNAWDFGLNQNATSALRCQLTPSNELYVFGFTRSSDFPVTADAYQAGFGGGLYDAVLFRLNAAGSALSYSTYLGGLGDEWSGDMDISASGDLYLTGYTNSTNFPTTPAVLRTTPSGDDCFVTKFDASHNLIYSTYLGGMDEEQPRAIKVTASDEVYIAGYTLSNDFPVTQGTFIDTDATKKDLFLTRINSSATGISHSAIFTGLSNQNEQVNGRSIAIDNDGNLYYCGNTKSADFYSTPGTFQSTKLGASNRNDAIFFKYSPVRNEILYATFMGGVSSSESFNAIVLDGNGDIYLAGNTNNPDFPVTQGAAQTSHAGVTDAIISKFTCLARINDTISSGQSVCQNGFVETILGSLPDLGASLPTILRNGASSPHPSPLDQPLTYRWQSSSDNVVWADISGAVDQNYTPDPTPIATTFYRRIVTEPVCNWVDTSNTHTLTILVNSAPTVDAGLDTFMCIGGSIVLGGSPTASGGLAPYNYEWFPNFQLDDTTIANPTSTANQDAIYTVAVTDFNGCEQRDQIIVRVVDAEAGNDALVCNGDAVQLGALPIASTSAVYTWTREDQAPLSGAELSDPNIAQPTAQPSASAGYVLTISGGQGCPSRDTVQLTVQSVTIDAGNDTSVCESTPDFQIGTPSQANHSYQWSPSVQLSADNIAQPNFDMSVVPVPNPMIYYLTVVHTPSGCSDRDTLAITVDQLPETIYWDTLPYSNCSGPVEVGFFDASASPVGTVYSWTGPVGATFVPNNSVAQPTVDLSGLYDLTATSPAGCVNTETVVVDCGGGFACPLYIIDPAPWLRTGFYICNGDSVSINTIAEVDTANYDFIWSGPSFTDSTKNITVGQAGTYMLTVTHKTFQNTCIDSAFVFSSIINVDAPDTALCPGDPPVTIGEPAIAGYSYQWSPEDSLSATNVAQPTANPSASTLYISLITETSTGCFIEDSVLVQRVQGTADAGTDVSFCNSITAVLGGTPSPDHAYLWSPGVGLDDSTSANPSLPLVSTATFFMTATDSLTGCITQDSVVYTLTPPPVANAGPDRTVCAAGNGTIIGTVAEAGLIYAWFPITGLTDPSAAQTLANPATNTTYTLSVSRTGPGGNTCTDSDTVTVTVSASAAPVADAGNDSTVCIGQSANLGTAALADHVYNWVPNIDLDDDSIAQPISSTLSDLCYTLMVTDTISGCSNVDSACIVVTIPTANAGPDTAICENASVLIGTTAIGGYTYAWDQAGSLDDPNLAQPTATPTSTTTYTVTVTDAGGCTITDQITITVNPAPMANAGPDIALCTSASPLLGTAAVGGNIYNWSPATALNNVDIARPTLSRHLFPNDTTINYILLVTNSNTGCTARDTVAVTDTTVANAGDDAYICLGDSAQIGSPALPGYSYSWNPVTVGLSSTTIAQPMASPPTDTEYRIVITTAGGCVKADWAYVFVAPDIEPVLGADETICNGGSVQLSSGLTAQPGLSFSWSPTSGLSDPTASDPIASPTSTTVYTLTATYIHNGGVVCTASDTITVAVNPLTAPPANAGNDTTICIGGTASIGTAAVAGLTYSWTPTESLTDPFAAQTSAIPTSTTTYTLEVTDNTTGCVSLDQVVVNTSQAIANVIPDDSVCVGGSIMIGNPAFNGNYTYAWTPTTGLDCSDCSGPVANPTASTTYTLLVTDTTTSCEATAAVRIDLRSDSIDADAGTDQTICEGKSVQIGTAPRLNYTYTWTANIAAPQTLELSCDDCPQPIATPSSTREYEMTVVDTTTGCTAVDVVLVVVNPAPTADAGPAQNTCLGGSGVQIGTAGLTNLTYQWSPAAGLTATNIPQPTANPNNSTVYTVVATDTITGCTNSDLVDIFIDTDPNLDAGFSQGLCNATSTILSSSPDTTGGIWTQLSGPSVAIFANDSSAITEVSGLISGDYVFTRTLTIGSCTAQDNVTIFNTICPATLPAELITFDGYTDECQAFVRWKTSSEEDLSHFELETSPNASDFELLEEVEARGGMNINTYISKQSEALQATNYYRLKVVDVNGSYYYSHIVAVDYDCYDASFELFPNPTTDGQISIKCHLQGNDITSEVVVRDMLGREILRQQIELQAGVNVFPFDVSKLIPGAYVVSLENKAHGILSRKLIRTDE